MFRTFKFFFFLILKAGSLHVSNETFVSLFCLPSNKNQLSIVHSTEGIIAIFFREPWAMDDSINYVSYIISSLKVWSLSLDFAEPCNQQEWTSFVQISKSLYQKLMSQFSSCHDKQLNKTKIKMNFQKQNFKPAPRCSFSIPNQNDPNPTCAHAKCCAGCSSYPGFQEAGLGVVVLLQLLLHVPAESHGILAAVVGAEVLDGGLCLPWGEREV